MSRLPILPNESNATICLPDSSLPSFYMEDYTVLGLRVGNLDAAVRLLEKNGISIFKSPGKVNCSSNREIRSRISSSC